VFVVDTEQAVGNTDGGPLEDKKMTTTTTSPGKDVPAIADGDTLSAVVTGQRVELPPMGAFETNLASELLAQLGSFARRNRLGRAVAEMLFLLAVVGTKRRPDVAFVSYGRWPRERRVPRAETWDVVPELAVEVVSLTNTAEEILAKIREYFRAGVQRVWVVYPAEELVYVYQSPTENRILSRKDELDGEEILPGFHLPVAELFGEEVQQ
jgi:Uma2 family endonuclease